MKKIAIAVLAIMCAGVVVAAGLDKVFIKVGPSSLTHVKTEGNSSKVTGYLERIDCSFLNSTSSVALHVFASNEVNGITTTILNLSAISNGASFRTVEMPMNTAGTSLTTNSFQRFMLYDERIYVTTTNATYSNQYSTVIAYFERP